jgi:hypothetical protein
MEEAQDVKPIQPPGAGPQPPGIPPPPPPTPAAVTSQVVLTPEQVSALVEVEVAKALAARPQGITWAEIRGNKYFVLATSSLAGALGEQIFEAVKNHTFAWNSHSLGAMLSVAAGTAATAVYHLYTQPNPPTATKD